MYNYFISFTDLNFCILNFGVHEFIAVMYNLFVHIYLHSYDFAELTS